MKIKALAEGYMEQYNNIMNRIKGLEPLLCIYSGEELSVLKRKINVYYSLAMECKKTAILLSEYKEG